MNGPAAPSRTVLALASCALLVMLVAVGVVLVRESERRLGGQRPEDFIQLYLVSWNLRQGESVYQELYTPPAVVAELGWEHEADYSFANPPALVPVIAPISLLPYPVGWWALIVFSVLAGWFSMFLAARELGWQRWPALLAGGFLVGSLPYLVLLVLNHIESLILLLGTAGWLALRRGRLRLGGALWGLCAAFKLFPALWILPLFRQDLRPAAWSAMAAGAAAMTVGIMIVGPRDAVEFVTVVVPQSGSWRQSAGNFALAARAGAFGAGTAGWALALLAGAATVWLLVRRRPSVDRIWVATTAAALLISPLSWSYYFVLLGPCFLILATTMHSRDRSQRILLYALAVALFYWPYLLGHWVEGTLPTTGPGAALALAVPSAAVCALLLLTLSLRESAETAAPLAREGVPGRSH